MATRIESAASRNVKETAGPKAKKDWELTGSAFRRLLGWLDEGVDSGGEKYLEIRRRLVSYFDRKNCPAPDELADETLNRVARKLEEDGPIAGTPPARYCYTIARFVFLEDLRRAGRDQTSLDDLAGSSHLAMSAAVTPELRDSPEDKEKLHDCLERCLRQLPPDHRELIIQYYRGEQRAKIDNRRTMAARFNLTMNALGIRACRIRSRLETCVNKCVAEG